jgi:5-methylcytosine-specific restriction protein A
MALADITREAVDLAILEYGQLGADAFLAHYGFAPAKRYWLELNGKGNSQAHSYARSVCSDQRQSEG